ncbi:CHAT domain-containing protein [Neolewinella lacunae]|uniref:CHAT domain-containing protein n=1 Tax=Neolewinella lacunae TaxID=1517758 RepID=A0A923PLH4_9BACT|nr:CHAT domain-containing protein [Neolewinella lacunae]MBC6992692.1 CHAT domain-containing protein [Neolewinella lacunae]MDN3633572.1 CHAT domain-containing protein [Neolewinella lacunae]
MDYLSRAITVADGAFGGAVYNWVKTRQRMRNNAAFSADVYRLEALVRELSDRGKDFSIAEIEARREELAAQRQQMRDKYPEHYADLKSDYSIDLRQIQRARAADSSAVIGFYGNAQIMYRLFVSADTIDLTILDDVKDRVRTLSEQLPELRDNAADPAPFHAALREIYGHLFSGIDGLLPERLHIIANDYLEQIPYSALRQDREGEAPRYLGVEKTLSRQFSLRSMELLQDIQLPDVQAQPLALAPVFENELLEASALRQAGFQLPPLLYNAEEVTTLQSIGPGRFYLANRATLRNFLRHADRHSIIHLATHAISSEVDGLASRVYLLDDAGQPVSLYAADIGNQTLNADLVTLSACETGAGSQHVVEGTVGLTKAFIAAGARGVVASNWAVDDRATAELMETFYRAIDAGQSPPAALRTARRTYLARHPEAHPSRWAAFESYGGRGIPRWEDAYPWWQSPWAYAALALFALLGAFWGVKKIRHA